MLKLKDRIESYQESSDYKLLNKLPLIISVNGRSFTKTTSLLDKPYCEKFSECILSTTLRLCAEMDGVVFAYQHNDEITIVAKNDQSIDSTPWMDNRIQKICSAISSITTMHFNNCANAIELNVIGDPTFTSQIFVAPNNSEASNTIIYKQQNNFHTSIHLACFYELLKKYDKNTIKGMLVGLSIEEKIRLLEQECSIDFHQYPIQFRRGVACYKVPKINEDGNMKNKWLVNMETPIFSKDQEFINYIIKNGSDIFRKESFR